MPKDNKLAKVRVDNFKMFVPPMYLPHYTQNEYEGFSSLLIKKLLKPKTVFVDIGAHLGYYTLLAASSNKNIEVVAFEPAKENLAVVKKNIKLNKIKNCSLYNLAASDKEGTQRFCVAEALGESSIHGTYLSKVKKITQVKTCRVDSIIKGKKVGFIKIDVEGHEVWVLDGLKKTLQDNSQVILLIELNPGSQAVAGVTPEQLLGKIKELGFKIFLLDETEYKYYDLDRVSHSWKKLLNRDGYANLLCVSRDTSWLIESLMDLESQKFSKQVEGLENQIKDYQQILETIKSARVFRLWQYYCKIRDYLLKKGIGYESKS